MKAFRHIWRAVFLALPVVLGASGAQGAFLLSFTGNTYPKDGPPTTIDAHVNFAVLDTSGGTAGDTWGTGASGFDASFFAGINSGALDTTANYLYLFQTVNDGTAPEALSQNTVGVTVANVTSFGYFDAGFTSGGSNVGAGTSLGPSAAAGDPSGTSLAAAPGVTLGGAGLVVPDFITQGSGSIVASFIFNNLAADAATTLWGYTSNIAPAFGPTSIQDGGTNASGTVPTAKATAPIPEPVTAVIWSALALGWMGLAMVRRRQTNGRTPWSAETRSTILRIVEGKPL